MSRHSFKNSMWELYLSALSLSLSRRMASLLWVSWVYLALGGGSLLSCGPPLMVWTESDAKRDESLPELMSSISIPGIGSNDGVPSFSSCSYQLRLGLFPSCSLRDSLVLVASCIGFSMGFKVICLYLLLLAAPDIMDI